jgi:HTH-type transcriptional regulator/antitoxin HipB
MNYPIKTLGQLPLMLKGFRKLRGLTQAAMAEKLGITQQSYAYFEANPATATLERLLTVLRLLDVEISMDQVAAETAPGKPARIVSGARKREAW